MKTTFEPRKAKGNTGKIRLVFNYGANRRLRYSTGLTISNINNWDYKKQRVKNVLTELYKVDINNALNDLQSEIEKEYTRLTVTERGDVNNQILKDICDSFFNIKPKKENQKLELLEFYQWFLDNFARKPLPSSGAPLSPGTLKTYRNALNILKRFNKEVYKLNYDKITLEFYDDFLEWLFDQNYSTNYIGTQIKVLKTIMNSAFERGNHNNLNYKKRHFKKPSEEVSNIYLNEKEIERLTKVNLDNFKSVKITKGFTATEKKMKQARDLFILSCYTGLRVSDFNRLKLENIRVNGDKYYFDVNPLKTKKPLSIPIHPLVKSILEANNNQPPQRLPAQHINYCIKHLGNLADLITPVKKSLTTGGQLKINTYLKHQLICNHTGRRSFCTNAYMAGMPVSDIMTLSGHKTERVFYSYIKASNFEKAERIGNHDFFN